ncbi:MAG: hypothetical protein ACQEXV_24465 [Bacillota bacterium]
MINKYIAVAVIVLAIVCGLVLNTSKQNPITMDQQEAAPKSKKYSGEKYVTKFIYKKVNDPKDSLMDIQYSSCYIAGRGDCCSV